MKNKLLLGVGIAAGYVLGSRSGRAAYDKLKARAAGVWDSKPVQDKVAVATEAIKEKAPEVADQLSEAARRAGTVLGSAMHREGSSGDRKSSTSDDATPAGASGTGTTGTSGGFGATGTAGTTDTLGTSATLGTAAAATSGVAGTSGAAGTTGAAGTSGTLSDADELGEDHIPAHSTHPETTNLGTTDENGPAGTGSKV
ncbi:hypothetical protein CXX84_12965 [Arthrobacter sp. AFG7.2]|uniref:hypothetical protein n=1 Tax=Arthrobacter sp. AFG7.2 TaxID=1688693 RepID=UPI000C9E0929|nr:hypothetical protein [Arthrobacter sp. AFG7.2]PNI08326.1 hypothetical protein CXX84_12965 [Arthrobacter sp. AFG7.2]